MTPPPLRVYLCARFSRWREMREVALAMRAAGIEVSSQWINLPDGDASLGMRIDDNESVARSAAIRDMTDLSGSHLVVAFLGGGRSGGRHVEVGMALALDIPVWTVGPRENVFHAMPGVRSFRSRSDMLSALVVLDEQRRKVLEWASAPLPCAWCSGADIDLIGALLCDRCGNCGIGNIRR